MLAANVSTAGAGAGTGVGVGTGGVGVGTGGVGVGMGGVGVGTGAGTGFCTGTGMGAGVGGDPTVWIGVGVIDTAVDAVGFGAAVVGDAGCRELPDCNAVIDVAAVDAVAAGVVELAVVEAVSLDPLLLQAESATAPVNMASLVAAERIVNGDIICISNPCLTTGLCAPVRTKLDDARVPVNLSPICCVGSCYV